MKLKIKTARNIGKQIENLGILLCITLLIFIFMNYNIALTDHTSQYYKNWHNIDLIFNIQNIINEINGAELYTKDGNLVYVPFDQINDTGTDFRTRPLGDYYIPSMNNIEASYLQSTKDLNKYFLWGLLDVMVLGILLGRKL